MGFQHEPIVCIAFGREVFLELYVVTDDGGGVEAATELDQVPEIGILYRSRSFGCPFHAPQMSITAS